MHYFVRSSNDPCSTEHRGYLTKFFRGLRAININGATESDCPGWEAVIQGNFLTLP